MLLHLSKHLKQAKCLFEPARWPKFWAKNMLDRNTISGQMQVFLAAIVTVCCAAFVFYGIQLQGAFVIFW